MLHLEPPHETLDTTVDCDDSSGLPLLDEQDDIFELILAFLPLPYSVAEYGCGKKTSLILEQLLRLGLPPYALERGMILEQDLSPAALDETDADRRPGALVVDNPLASQADLRDPKLRAILDANCVQVSADGDTIQAGPFTLRHRPRVQFVVARSHIFPTIWFWDDENRRVVRRVLDPTVRGDGLFAVEEMREHLSAPESLVLTASLLDRFRLHPDYLTPSQRRRVEELRGDASLLYQPYDEHARLIRALTGAEKGTIGDPEGWTYANNVLFGDAVNDERHQELTGRGEPLRLAARRLFDAREEHARELTDLRAELVALIEELDLPEVVRRDADVAERRLQPLAEVANTVAYYHSLRALAERLDEEPTPSLACLDDPDAFDDVWGFGVSLRSRLEKVAAVSEDEQGRIDARALNERFIAASVETARQMDRAGLDVFVDRVGNLHGLLLDDSTRRELDAGRLSLSEICGRSICHASHIDTVEDAGKYDGRLGVLSGVEIAHILTDLRTYFDRDLVAGAEAFLQVSAFIGEEMTFTGENVSMPGSAAVAGLASVERVHEMVNGDGDRFGDRLADLLRALDREEAEGRLRRLRGERDPADFFTAHTFERHIEQGPVLDRVQVPLVLVDTIMGIHQEDFYFEGAFAEPAALEMNARCRDLVLEREELRGVRLTVGILQEMGDDRCFEEPSMALLFTLHGERNHAGGTRIEDRRDPGVAAARVARELRRWVVEYNRSAERPVLPLVGGVRLLPGTGRNVIPGIAELNVGIQGDLPEERRGELERALSHFISDRLPRSVSEGGEGVLWHDVQRASFLNTARRVRLSVDLRAAEPETLEGCRRAIAEVVAELEREMGVSVTGSVEQQVPPRPLSRTGQVLQIERSYGGSHNPNEMELARDLVRGTVLQLAATRRVLAGGVEGLNLFRVVREHLPESWHRRLGGFVSGALHDTCNVSAAVLERRRADAPATVSQAR